MSDFMSPGRRIRHYRMLRGMTQKALGALAEALGISPSVLDIPCIKSREALKQLLLALEDEYGLTVTIMENNERSICNGK